MKRAVGIALAAFVMAFVPTLTSGAAGDADAIREVMNNQLAAWNRGDVSGFLDGYAHTEDLIFASRGTFARGWDSLLERYKAAYPTGKMGTLTFSDVEIHFIGESAAWVIGKWSLEMADRRPHGAFTLIFEKRDEGWRIIHDHSSGVPEPADGATQDGTGHE